MANPRLSRLSLWAIGLITGLDVYGRPDLITFPTETHEENAERLDAQEDAEDAGLTWPNTPAVLAACQKLHLPDGPLLLGKPIKADYCQALLLDREASQITRFAASWHWCRLDINAPCVDTRAIWTGIHQ